MLDGACRAGFTRSIEQRRDVAAIEKLVAHAVLRISRTGQRAKLRLASVIALDRISQRLRRFDQEADVEGMLADTVASVTLMANANDTDDSIEYQSTNIGTSPPGPSAVEQRQRGARVSRVDRDTALHL